MPSSADRPSARKAPCWSPERARDLRAPSYVEHNHPGSFEMLEDQAAARDVFGQHDPFGKLAEGACVCAVAVDGTPGGPCVDFDIDGDDRIDPETETIEVRTARTSKTVRGTRVAQSIAEPSFRVTPQQLFKH